VSNIPIQNAATAVAVTKNHPPPVGRTSEQEVNLCCKASIEAFFPKKKKEGRWELQVPIHFCMSVERVKEFRGMTLSQQKEKKNEWKDFSNDEKKKIQASIPGVACTYCGCKQRCDKGSRKTATTTLSLGASAPPIQNQATDDAIAAVAITVATKDAHPPVGSPSEQQINLPCKASIEAFFPKKKKDGRFDLQVPIHFCMLVEK
jgi:hypothetical protein